MAGQAEQGRDPLRHGDISRLVVVAPNWLGDAVMALPALADIRRTYPTVSLTVAARPAVAPMFTLADGVDAVLPLDAGGPFWRDTSEPLRAGQFDAALLFPNSFHVAWMVKRAGIRERWGYATDLRRPLLTRHAAPPVRVHQAAYYQHLTSALGCAAGPCVPALSVSSVQRTTAAAVLRQHGWDGVTPFVVMAAGAAYGGAKRWPAERFAATASRLWAAGLVTVLIGSPADAAAGVEFTQALTAGGADLPGGSGRVEVINVIGRTDLPALAAVLVLSHGLVTNDSGAMHLAAALAVPVTAIFGPTDDTATYPIGRASTRVLTHDVWCRPCMLRECPLDHRCMRGVTAERAATAVLEIGFRTI